MLRKICEVFTKEYRKETEYREFVSKMIHCFKLKIRLHVCRRNGSNWAEYILYFYKHKKSA